MARYKRKEFTVDLKIRTDEARKKLEMSVNDMKEMLADLAQPMDKVKYFKEFIDYISQMDKALTALETKHKGKAREIFDGIDAGLREAVGQLVGATPASMSAFNDIWGRISGSDAAKVKSAELKKFASEINELYQALGKEAPLNIEDFSPGGKGKQFTDKQKIEKINLLKEALLDFAQSMDAVSDRVKNGFGFGAGTADDLGLGNYFKTIAETVKKEIGEIEGQVNKYKNLLASISSIKNVRDYINDRANIDDPDAGGLTQDEFDEKYKDWKQPYAAETSIEKTITLFKEYARLRKELDNIEDVGSDEYNLKNVELLDVAGKLLSTLEANTSYEDKTNNWIKQFKDNGISQDDIASIFGKTIDGSMHGMFDDVKSEIEEYFYEFDDEVANVVTNSTQSTIAKLEPQLAKAKETIGQKIQEALNGGGSGTGTGGSGTPDSNATQKAAIAYDDLIEKLREYQRLIAKQDDGFDFDDDGTQLQKKVDDLDAYFERLSENKDEIREILDIVGNVGYNGLDPEEAMKSLKEILNISNNSISAVGQSAKESKKEVDSLTESIKQVLMHACQVELDVDAGKSGKETMSLFGASGLESSVEGVEQEVGADELVNQMVANLRKNILLSLHNHANGNNFFSQADIETFANMYYGQGVKLNGYITDGILRVVDFTGISQDVAIQIAKSYGENLRNIAKRNPDWFTYDGGKLGITDKVKDAASTNADVKDAITEMVNIALHDAFTSNGVESAIKAFDQKSIGELAEYLVKVQESGQNAIAPLEKLKNLLAIMYPNKSFDDTRFTQMFEQFESGSIDGSKILQTIDDIDRAEQSLDEFYALWNKINKQDYSELTDIDIGQYIGKLEAAQKQLKELGKQGLLTAEQLEKADSYFDTAKSKLNSETKGYTGHGDYTSGGTGSGTGTDGSVQGTETASKEVADLEEVRKKVAEIEDAVRLKTGAFNDEQTAVDGVVTKEIESLKRLEEYLGTLSSIIESSISSPINQWNEKIESLYVKIQQLGREFSEINELITSLGADLNMTNDGSERKFAIKMDTSYLEGTLSTVTGDIKSSANQVVDAMNELSDKLPASMQKLSENNVKDTQNDNWATVIVNAINTQGKNIVEAIKIVLPSNISDGLSSGNNTISEEEIVNAFQHIAREISLWTDNVGGTPKDFFNDLKNNNINLDSNTKSALKTLGMLSDNGQFTFNIASEGLRNLGVAVAKEFVLPTRPARLDQTSELVPLLKEAAELGAAVPRIMSSFIGDNTIFELQTRMHGDNVASANTNFEFLKATNKQIDGLLHTFDVMSKVGLYPDFIGDNVLFDDKNGFSLVDIETKDIAFDRYIKSSEDMSNWFLDYIRSVAGVASNFSDFEKRFRERMALPSSDRLVNENTVAQNKSDDIVAYSVNTQQVLSEIDAIIEKVRQLVLAIGNQTNAFSDEIQQLGYLQSSLEKIIGDTNLDQNDTYQDSSNNYDTYDQTLGDLYELESDDAKRAIDDFAIFYQEYNELMAKINKEPIDIMSTAYPTDEDRAKVNEVLEELKQKQLEISKMPLVDATDDDIKKLHELQAEVLGLQNVLKGAKIIGADASDYLARYNLSKADAELMNKVINSDSLYDLEDELNSKLFDKQDRVIRESSFDFGKKMAFNTEEFDEFILEHAKSLLESKYKNTSYNDDYFTQDDSANISDENVQLSTLIEQLETVKLAVQAKTKAFYDEGTVVGQVVGKEIAALLRLKELLNSISGQIDAISDGFAQINTNAPKGNGGKDAKSSGEVQAGDGTISKEGAGSQSKATFSQQKSNQKSVFNQYREEAEKSIYITDELRERLNKLALDLQSVDDESGLKDWNKAFIQFKNDLSFLDAEGKKRKTAQLTGTANSLKKDINSLFDIDGSNLEPDQEKIKQHYLEIIQLIDQQKLAVKNGKEVEMDAINQKIAALTKETEAYKVQHDMINTQGKSGSKYGATAMQNTTAKFKSLEKATGAGSGFEESSVVKTAFAKYKAAYEQVEAMRKALSEQTSKITDSQDAEFRRLIKECNNYGNALNKVLTDSKKLWARAANSDPYTLEADFVDDNQGRKRALEDFAQSMYGVTLAADDFKKGYTECVFAVDNGDGTFTKMTATFDSARTQIVALAGDTQKATTALERWFDGLKNKFVTISQYLLANFGWQEVWQAIRQGVQYVREIDLALTELKKVTSETDATYDAFLQTASKTASVIGSTVSDFVNATADFARLGYDINQAADLATAASVYKNVGDGITDVAQASESIISTMKAFGIEANDAMGIVDRFNEVGNNFAISSTGIGEAMQRSASALYEAGNTIDESIALITGANSVIQNPEQVGK